MAKKKNLNVTIDADVAEHIRTYANERDLSISSAANRLLATGLVNVDKNRHESLGYKDVLGFHSSTDHG